MARFNPEIVVDFGGQHKGIGAQTIHGIYEEVFELNEKRIRKINDLPNIIRQIIAERLMWWRNDIMEKMEHGQLPGVVIDAEEDGHTLEWMRKETKELGISPYSVNGPWLTSEDGNAYHIQRSEGDSLFDGLIPVDLMDKLYFGIEFGNTDARDKYWEWLVGGTSKLFGRGDIKSKIEYRFKDEIIEDVRAHIKDYLKRRNFKL